MIAPAAPSLPNAPLSREAAMAAAAAGALALALGLALAIGLWMPGVGYDDGYFSGPAIRFALTGEMRSFLLDDDAVLAGNGPPFWYPPLFFYAFGAWLMAFGCSTASALSFCAATAAAAASGMSLALARFACSPRWCFAGALIGWSTFYTAAAYSFRPEQLALALLLMGLPLIPSCSRVLQCLGFVLGGLGLIVAPRVAGWGVVFGLLFVVAARGDKRALARSIVIGAAIVALVFAASVRFDVAGFLRAFSAHAGMRWPPLDAALWNFGNFLTTGFGKLTWSGMLLVLVAGTAASLALGRARAVAPLVATFCAALLLALLTGGYGVVIFIYLTALALWGMPGALPPSRPMRGAVLAVCVVLAGLPLAVTAALFAIGRHQSPEMWAGYRAIAAAVEAKAWRTVWIDHFSLRYVFDMRPPPTARAFESHGTRLANEGRPRDADTVFVVSQTVLHAGAPARFADQTPIRAFGRSFMIYARPQIHLITQDSVLSAPR